MKRIGTIILVICLFLAITLLIFSNKILPEKKNITMSQQQNNIKFEELTSNITRINIYTEKEQYKIGDKIAVRVNVANLGEQKHEFKISCSLENQISFQDYLIKPYHSHDFLFEFSANLKGNFTIIARVLSKEMKEISSKSKKIEVI